MTSQREKLKDARGGFPFPRRAPLGQLLTPECRKLTTYKTDLHGITDRPKTILNVYVRVDRSVEDTSGLRSPMDGTDLLHWME
jgi:hypothetical protein